MISTIPIVSPDAVEENGKPSEPCEIPTKQHVECPALKGSGKDL